MTEKLPARGTDRGSAFFSGPPRGVPAMPSAATAAPPGRSDLLDELDGHLADLAFTLGQWDARDTGDDPDARASAAGAAGAIKAMLRGLRAMRTRLAAEVRAYDDARPGPSAPQPPPGRDAPQPAPAAPQP